MSRAQLRNKISADLCTSSFTDLALLLAHYDEQQLLSPLFSFLCSADECLKWRAVSSLGIVVPSLATKDMEAGRVVMRRFLWSLNDESGGIGWGAPEAMAEIMCNHQGLREEYLHMLLSYMREDGDELCQDGNYLELPLLQQGLLWGVGRLCKECPEVMCDKGVIPDLLAYLESDDTTVMALALRSLGFLNMTLPEKYKYLGQSTERIRVYDKGEFLTLALSSFIV